MTPAPELFVTKRQRALILVGVFAGLFVAATNQTSITTVLPTIAADLDDFERSTWVFTAYMLASAIALPVFGKLGDIYGRRSLYIVGISVFILGAVTSALSQSMEQLIAARVIQGIGMAGVMPMALAIVADVIPARERGKWQSVTGAVFALATILGPVVGGAVADSLGWRWVFWVNLPLGIVVLATIVTQMHIPYVARPTRVDWLGILSLGGALTLLLLALTEGGTAYAWSSARILGMLGAVAILLGAFAITELRTADPLIPLELLRDRNVVATSAAGFAIGAGLFVAIFYVPLFMQAAAGVSAAQSGLALTPLMLALVTTSTISGLLISKTGRYKALISAGPLIAAIGFYLMYRLPSDPSPIDTGWRVLVVGGGTGASVHNLVLVAQNAVNARHTGVTTSLATLARSLGGTVGVAAFGAALYTRLSEQTAERLASVARGDSIQRSDSANAAAILNSITEGTPSAVTAGARLGLADVLSELFLLGSLFMAAAFVACLLLRSDELSTVAAIRISGELEHDAPTPSNSAASNP